MNEKQMTAVINDNLVRIRSLERKHSRLFYALLLANVVLGACVGILIAHMLVS